MSLWIFLQKCTRLLSRDRNGKGEGLLYFLSIPLSPSNVPQGLVDHERCKIMQYTGNITRVERGGNKPLGTYYNMKKFRAKKLGEKNDFGGQFFRIFYSKYNLDSKYPKIPTFPDQTRYVSNLNRTPATPKRFCLTEAPV